LRELSPQTRDRSTFNRRHDDSFTRNSWSKNLSGGSCGYCVIGTIMSGDANRVRTDDWNLTAGFDLKRVEKLRNITDEFYPIPDCINVTSLPDVNTTEKIDSFYFYEVSRISTFFDFIFCIFRDRKGYKLYIVCNFWSSHFLIHRAIFVWQKFGNL